MKLLLLIAVVVVAYWIIKAYKKRLTAHRRMPASDVGEDMVRCAHCGVHLPRSESLMSGDVFYCSPSHRQLHQQPD